MLKPDEMYDNISFGFVCILLEVKGCYVVRLLLPQEEVKLTMQ